MVLLLGQKSDPEEIRKLYWDEKMEGLVSA